jgi:hypothetical protein
MFILIEKEIPLEQKDLDRFHAAYDKLKKTSLFLFIIHQYKQEIINKQPKLHTSMRKLFTEREL